jgi:hypothetical protein
MADACYVLKRLIDDGYAPKLVVENAWEYTLNLHAYGSGANGYSNADQESTLLDEAAWLANLGDLPDLYQKFKAAPSGQNRSKLLNFIAQRMIPLYGDRYGILRILCHGASIGPCGASLPGVDAVSASRYLEADPQGFIALTGQSLADLTPSERSRAMHGEFTYGQDLAHFTAGGQQIGYLHKLLALAQSHHIQVVLVTSPLNKIFFAYLHPASTWRTAIVPFWQSIAAQYHIQYFDESRPAGYSDADWRDPEHLDAPGAAKFSTWLAQKVVIPSLG